MLNSFNFLLKVLLTIELFSAFHSASSLLLMTLPQFPLAFFSSCNSYPRANAVIFEVAPAGPDASIFEVFKGASEHDCDGGCGVGDGNGNGVGG